VSIPASVSHWLAQTPISIYVQDTVWVIPTIQSVHILAIGIVMASIAMLDLRLAGVLGREQSLQGMTRRFYPWIWGALGVLLVTGVLMILGEPSRELLNFLFWTKMGLILAAVLFTMPVRSMLDDCRYRDLVPTRRRILRWCAFLSLLLWVAVLSCGRWIAYVGA
jgi:hypothetical protein